jgi:hypothetical protein
MRWRTRIRLWWSRLWIRKNEFHSSLDSDNNAVMEMSMEQRHKYQADLYCRRKIAHQRSLRN